MVRQEVNILNYRKASLVKFIIILGTNILILIVGETELVDSIISKNDNNRYKQGGYLL